MKNKFSRSVTAIMLTAALLITSQGVVTAFADDENYSDASEYSSVQTTEVKGNETPSSNESDAEPEQKECICGAVDDNAHDESCPLYVKPDGGNTDGDNTEDDAAQFTCGAEEGGSHKEDCPLYVKPDGGNTDNGNTNDGDTDNGTGEDAAVKDVVEMINALPAAETITEATDLVSLKDQVNAARVAYDALAEADKTQVTNYSLLTDMEANIAYIMQAVNTLPAEVKQPEVNYPSETSTVDYSKRQSDSVTYDGYNYDDNTNTFTLHYTINENAGTNIIIEPSREVINAYTDQFGFNSLMPGDSKKFKIEINNKSSHTYHYKNNSFVIAPEDTSKFGSIEEGSLLPVLTYDGKLLPIRNAAAMLPLYFEDLFDTSDNKISFDMLCQIYEKLHEKGYTGETPLTDYMLAYFNDKYSSNYTNLSDVFADHPGAWGTPSSKNGIYTMSESELLNYINQYPWINSFVYVVPKGSLLDVQIKWPEPEELTSASYNSFYQDLFSAVYSKENVDILNPNSGTTFSRAHGIGDYLPSTDLYQETNQYFSNLTANGLNTGDTLEIWSAYALDGPGMGNSYQNYSFSFYSIFELEDPSTSPEEPEEPTPDPDPDPTPRPGGGDEDDDTPTIINETPVPTTTIEDEDVPMADLPEDTVTIDDEEVPLKDNPNTGDAFPVAAMAAAALSLGGVVALNRKKK